MDREIVRIKNSIEGDPELVIGTAKELIESVCKTILKQRGNGPTGDEKLPELIQKTLQSLDLFSASMEEQKTKEAVKKILGALATLVQSTAELRNLHGTGHGRDGQTAALDSKYATLSLNAAAALTLFLIQAHAPKRPSDQQMVAVESWQDQSIFDVSFLSRSPCIG